MSLIDETAVESAAAILNVAPANQVISFYLDPSELTPNEANEKARPTEKPEDRARRVELMAQSIRRNGQKYPVLIVEVDDVDDAGGAFSRYEYVDGGCRVDAIATLQAIGCVNKVWCSLLDSSTDLFLTAVIGNLHRTQNSVLDIAHIIMETRERNGWTTRGGAAKAADTLGLPKSRISEYEKILRAPKTVIARIESGEITSLDAALKLMSVAKEEQEEVAKRAKELASQERNQREIKASQTREMLDSRYDDLKSGRVKPIDGEEFFEELAESEKNLSNDPKSEPEYQPASSTALMPNIGEDSDITEVLGTAEVDSEVLPAKESEPGQLEQPVRIKARHIEQAAREIVPEAAKMKRSRQDILDWFTDKCRKAEEGGAEKAFLDYLVGVWAVGGGSDKKMDDLWERLTFAQVCELSELTEVN